MSVGVRLVVAAVVGCVVGVGTVMLGAGSYAAALGWDAGAVFLLAWMWLSVWPMDSAQTAAHATREDPVRAVADPLLLIAAVGSLAAVGIFLLQAGSAKGSARDLLAGVGLATVAVSWFLVHTVYMLRYALLYYSGEDGGIDFNQRTPPRYSDFAYLAFTLGMTFQVSDTDLQTPVIRATVLRHALLSYLFGTVILATTVNLIAGLASTSR